MALLPFPLEVVVLVPLPDLFPVLGLGLGLLLEFSPFMAWFPVPAPSPTGGPGFVPVLALFPVIILPLTRKAGSEEEPNTRWNRNGAKRRGREVGDEDEER